MDAEIKKLNNPWQAQIDKLTIPEIEKALDEFQATVYHSTKISRALIERLNYLKSLPIPGTEAQPPDLQA